MESFCLPRSQQEKTDKIKVILFYWASKEQWMHGSLDGLNSRRKQVFHKCAESHSSSLTWGCTQFGYNHVEEQAIDRDFVGMRRNQLSCIVGWHDILESGRAPM